MPITIGKARYTLDSVQELAADTTLSYSEGDPKRIVSAGDVVEAGAYKFEVVAAVSSDDHISTANGVLLKALPDSKGFISTEQWNPDKTGVEDCLAKFQQAADYSFDNGWWLSSEEGVYRMSGQFVRPGGGGPTRNRTWKWIGKGTGEAGSRLNLYGTILKFDETGAVPAYTDILGDDPGSNGGGGIESMRIVGTTNENVPLAMIQSGGQFAVFHQVVFDQLGDGDGAHIHYAPVGIISECFFINKHAIDNPYTAGGDETGTRTGYGIRVKPSWSQGLFLIMETSVRGFSVAYDIASEISGGVGMTSTRISNCQVSHVDKGVILGEYSNDTFVDNLYVEGVDGDKTTLDGGVPVVGTVIEDYGQYNTVTGCFIGSHADIGIKSVGAIGSVYENNRINLTGMSDVVGIDITTSLRGGAKAVNNSFILSGGETGVRGIVIRRDATDSLARVVNVNGNDFEPTLTWYSNSDCMPIENFLVGTVGGLVQYVAEENVYSLLGGSVASPSIILDNTDVVGGGLYIPPVNHITLDSPSTLNVFFIVINNGVGSPTWLDVTIDVLTDNIVFADGARMMMKNDDPFQGPGTLRLRVERDPTQLPAPDATIYTYAKEVYRVKSPGDISEVTQANVLDVSHSINTRGKHIRKSVWITDVSGGIMAYAQGSAAGDGWIDLAGTVHTPV